MTCAYKTRKGGWAPLSPYARCRSQERDEAFESLKDEREATIAEDVDDVVLLLHVEGLINEKSFTSVVEAVLTHQIMVTKYPYLRKDMRPSVETIEAFQNLIARRVVERRYVVPELYDDKVCVRIGHADDDDDDVLIDTTLAQA